jgi:hypothetical protein
MPELAKIEFSVLNMREKFFDPEREMRMRLNSRGHGKSMIL